MIRKDIQSINANDLMANTFGDKKSNIINVLSKYITRKLN